MIAEENLSDNQQPNISFAKTSLIPLILELMKQNVPFFKSYIESKHHNKENLNEDELTQIYIEQAQILIRNLGFPFNISSQYRDIYHESKGFSDFYFFPNEQGVANNSLFSVESKRLPSPTKVREKEYVIGDKNNGGIERYKSEKHGKGLSECGLLGFIEEENKNHWLTKINSWITEIAISDNFWNNDEVLSEIESESNFCFLKSIAHRKINDINLYHLWINLNDSTQS